jgi:hypothetical protein
LKDWWAHLKPLLVNLKPNTIHIVRRVIELLIKDVFPDKNLVKISRYHQNLLSTTAAREILRILIAISQLRGLETSSVKKWVEEIDKNLPKCIEHYSNFYRDLTNSTRDGELKDFS